MRTRAAIALSGCLAGIYLVYQILPGDAIRHELVRSACALAVALAACAPLLGGRPAVSRPGPLRPPADAASLGAGVALCLAAVAAGAVATAYTLKCGGAAPGAADLWARVSDPVRLAASAVALCCATALWEETAFRLVVPVSIERLSKTRSRPALFAAVVSAILFAVLHRAGPAEGAVSLVRPVEAFLFGIVMSAVAHTRCGLAGCIATHALFDCVCFLAGTLSGGPGLGGPSGPSTAELAQLALDPGFAATAAIMLLLPAAASVAMLHRAD